MISRNNLVNMSVSPACHSIVYLQGVQMLQTEMSAICNTWWLKATFQEPGENAAASAIGGAWNVGTRWFIGDRGQPSAEANINHYPSSLGLFWILLDFILVDKGYQVLELEATSVLGDTLAPSHIRIKNMYIYIYYRDSTTFIYILPDFTQA